MPRGFLGGVIWGGACGLVLSGAASLWSDLPERGAGVDGAGSGAAEVEAQPKTDPEAQISAATETKAPRADAPRPGAASADKVAMQAQPPVKPTSPKTENPDAPVAPGTVQGPEQSPEQDLGQNPETLASVLPETSPPKEQPIPALPAPSVPDIPVQSADTPPDAPVLPADPQVKQRLAPQQAAPEIRSAAPPKPAPANPAPELGAVPRIAEGPAPDTVPRVDADVPVVLPEPEPEEFALAEPEPAPALETAREPGNEAPPIRPAVRQPGATVGALTDRQDRAQTGRLPNVTSFETDQKEFAPEPKRAGFENPDDKPLLSLILLETAAGASVDAGLLNKLAAVQMPVSVAIDVRLPDATARARAIRARGAEVLALVDLPANLTASDTEVAMSAALRAVPGAVGIFEGTESGLQGNSVMSQHVAEIAGAQGLGVIWQSSGLGAAHRNAQQSGVPSRQILRNLDEVSQNARVIRRFLDNAAFKARQQDGVVLAGQLSAETVEAILSWYERERAAKVAAAPISALFAGP